MHRRAVDDRRTEPNAIGREPSEGYGNNTADAASVTRRVEDIRRVSTMLMIASSVAFVLFEGLRGSRIGSKITGEGDLWNYVCSLVYFVAGEMAVLNGLLVLRRTKGQSTVAWLMAWLPWMLAGIAFTYAACDEMLEIHERLRHAIELAVPGLDRAFPGHGSRLLVAACAVCAAIFSVAFLRQTLVGRTSRYYLTAGFVLVGFAAAFDTAPWRPWFGAQFWSVSEESAEFFAGVMFTASFLSSASARAAGILESLVSAHMDSARHHEPIEMAGDPEPRKAA